MIEELTQEQTEQLFNLLISYGKDYGLNLETITDNDFLDEAFVCNIEVSIAEFLNHIKQRYFKTPSP